MMGFEIVFTLGVLGVALVLMTMELLSPDVILLGGLVLVTLGGVIDMPTAMSGFSNPTLLALGSLYIVAAALREAGALDMASHYILGEKASVRVVLARMCPSVTVYSAFLNNTPIVAMGIPAIRGWCRRRGISPSLLLMPLSFASILGGVCTLIGTSTNLVTHGLMQSHGLPGLSFFELAWVGIPCAVIGLAYLILVSPTFLRPREDIREVEERERSELVELDLEPDSPLTGKTVDEAALRRLPGLALTHIQRGEMEIAPVDPSEQLETGDRLLYAPVDGAVEEQHPDLSRYPGLRLSHKDVIERERDKELHQVVVRPGSPLVGATLGEVRFLERFGAAVTGIRREGRRVAMPIDQVELQPGDTLMLDTGRGFREAFEEAEEFFVASEAGGEEEGQAHEIERAGMRQLMLSVVVLVVIIVSVAVGLLEIAQSAALGALVLIGTGIINPGEAREAVDWSVLVVIGASLGLGKAMEASGAAQLLGDSLIEVAMPFGPLAVFAGVVVGTTLLTQIITNNGAVALMFPVVFSLSETIGYDPRPFLIGMTLAGSMSLLTPIGYQTNLMVYGPGNYRFVDFFRVGGPLQVVLWMVIVLVTPLMWSFR